MGDIVPSFPDPILVELPLTALKEAALEQKFYPWSVYLTADYELNCCWTLTGGAGHAMRPPTLTELYAYGSFIGSLQPGLTFVEGDPLLDPEKLTQIDLGIRGDLGGTRVSLNGFYAWVNDYITYDDIGELYHPTPTFKPTVDFQHVAYVNTDLATLMGFEFFAEYDFSCKLTGFARMSYVEGRDHTRRKPSRIAAITRERNGLDPDTPRSFNGVVGSEWLPGIPPLETRLGLHLHEASPNPYWGVELETRIVDRQERVARTLFEAETPGFVIWNLRGYWRACEDFTLFAGVENFTDRFYREHLDYRPGRSVYRPGVNFYFLSQVVY
jgi:outer membrane receptor protein involved in Fe transport